MINTLLEFWNWLTGRTSTNYSDWRSIVEPEPQTAAGATADPAAPTEPAAPLPIGARFRKPTTDYSPTVGQVDELNRLLKTIRPLPQGVIKVMQELNRPDASAASVGEAIECEPVMAASMVRLANSSSIGLRREITSVTDAVAYLGFSTTKSLLLKFNVDALLPNSRPGHGYDSGKLWVHAMAVAQVAEEIARRAGGADPSLALTAGLLHDIGKLAINSQYKDAIEQLWVPGADPEEGLLERERRLFQADHAFIGGTLAAEWKLPHEIVEIIRYHHSPQSLPAEVQPEARRALLAVHIANQLVKHRHVYCEGMEIDEIPIEMTSELGLPDWATLMADGSLQSIVGRVIQLNGGATAPTGPTAVAA